MKVHLDINLLPSLAEAVGDRTIDFDFSGKTITDVVSGLVEIFGVKAEQALHDHHGSFDPMIHMTVNDEKWITPDLHDTELQDGDRLTLMMIIGGG